MDIKVLIYSPHLRILQHLCICNSFKRSITNIYCSFQNKIFSSLWAKLFLWHHSAGPYTTCLPEIFPTWTSWNLNGYFFWVTNFFLRHILEEKNALLTTFSKAFIWYFIDENKEGVWSIRQIIYKRTITLLFSKCILIKMSKE